MERTTLLSLLWWSPRSSGRMGRGDEGAETKEELLLSLPPGGDDARGEPEGQS